MSRRGWISAGLAATCASLLAFQAARAQHTIVGIAIDADNPAVSIDDVVAVALDPGEPQKILAQSDPTKTDGHFRFALPAAASVFLLKVYDRQSRYWIYSPKDAYNNNRDPRNFGKILLSTIRVSRNGHPPTAGFVKSQLRESAIVRLSDPAVGDLYTSEIASRYTQSISACPAAGEFGNFHLAAFAEPVLIEEPQSDAADDQARLRIHARILENEKSVISAIHDIHKLEREYFARMHAYATGADLVEQKLADLGLIYRAGYCVEPVAGVSSGGVFHVAPSETSSYLVYAGPLFRGATGNFFFYSQSPDDIRYSREPVRSLSEAKRYDGRLPSSIQ